MKNILITGVTGFVGGELLVELSKDSHIDKIYCLLRAQCTESALKRLEKVFALHDDFFDKEKVIPIIGELTDPSLPEALFSNPELKKIDTIIHSAANTSFSKIYNDIVEKVNIGGMRHILQWAQTLEGLELFVYVGTASICGKTHKNSVVKEDWSPNTEVKHLVKYSYTKMMGELMLQQYLPEEKTLVVRPSIIMGDSRDWKPRSYVILWALATLNELRLFPSNPNSALDIIPIDYAVKAIIELINNKQRKYKVYHISSGKESATTPEKVTNAISNFFPEKPDFKFVPKSLLSEMKKWSKNPELIGTTSQLYAYRNYLDYWLINFEESSNLRILFYALEPYIDFIELGHIFDNSRLLEDTKVGQSVAAHDYIRNSGNILREINIFEGAVDF